MAEQRRLEAGFATGASDPIRIYGGIYSVSLIDMLQLNPATHRGRAVRRLAPIEPTPPGCWESQVPIADASVEDGARADAGEAAAAKTYTVRLSLQTAEVFVERELQRTPQEIAFNADLIEALDGALPPNFCNYDGSKEHVARIELAVLDSAPGQTARAAAVRASAAANRAALQEQVAYHYEVKKWEKTPFERPTKQAQLKAKNACAVLDAPEPCDDGGPESHALKWRGRRYISLQYALHGAPESGNGADESGAGAAATKADVTPATSGDGAPSQRVGPYAKLRSHWTWTMWQAVSPSHKTLAGCTNFSVWIDEDALRGMADAADDAVDSDPPAISWFVDFIYRYILCESCSRLTCPPLIFKTQVRVVRERPRVMLP